MLKIIRIINPLKSYGGVVQMGGIVRVAARQNLYSSSTHLRTSEKSPIYTRTGDKGTSMLFTGERKVKDDITFEALGTQDELNAVIGIAREYCKNNVELSDMLIDIQSRIFDLGVAVATPLDTISETKKAIAEFDTAHTLRLEGWIDTLDSTLPPLKNFIIPSGGLCGCHLHLARTVCRRAERNVAGLIREGKVSPEVGKYLNRLSDFLFVAARSASMQEGVQEVVWRKSTCVVNNK